MRITSFLITAVVAFGFVASGQAHAGFCGDVVVDPGETCDDGNTDDDDGCRNDCTFCGDGVLNGFTLVFGFIVGISERCDDGNTNDADDCNNTCELPHGVVLHNGTLDSDPSRLTPFVVSDPDFAPFWEGVTPANVDVNLDEDVLFSQSCPLVGCGEAIPLSSTTWTVDWQDSILDELHRLKYEYRSVIDAGEGTAEPLVGKGLEVTHIVKNNSGVDWAGYSIRLRAADIPVACQFPSSCEGIDFVSILTRGANVGLVEDLGFFSDDPTFPASVSVVVQETPDGTPEVTLLFTPTAMVPGQQFELSYTVNHQGFPFGPGGPPDILPDAFFLYQHPLEVQTGCIPSDEVCDGQDNDCDNIVDEGFIDIHAATHTVGSGSHPGSTKDPLVGIEVCAYDKADGSCSRVTCGGISHQYYDCIVNTCPSTSCCTTDAAGECTIEAPPGDYIVISADATKTVLPDPLGVSASDLLCGELKQKHLQQIIKVNTVDASVKKIPGKTRRLTGSELLIIEPEFVVWDSTEQLYPFIFETIGDWSVTTSVTQPEGFVSDYEGLSAQIYDGIESVQFTITEVGSDLVPTETTFDVIHKGRRQKIKSKVDIFLTSEYAKSRGFDPKALKTKGLIKERHKNQGQGDERRNH